MAINDHRKRKLIQWLPLWSTDVDSAPGIEATIAEQLAVREALAALPPMYRIPLVLYSTEGYSVAEIAAMLEVSTGTVKIRLYRAREKFRHAYGVREDVVSSEPNVAFGGKRNARVNLSEEEQ